MLYKIILKISKKFDQPFIFLINKKKSPLLYLLLAKNTLTGGRIKRMKNL